ncbi:MAG: dihydrodipicolinate synthase family protein [Candidatus Dormibacteraceae bacterium]
MSKMDLAPALAGVIAIPVTPFGADGQVDEAAYRRIVLRLVEGGVGVVTPNGNTGEFYALTEKETRRNVELSVAAARGHGVGVLAGVGYDLERAVEAARHAVRAGADGVMIHQPLHPHLHQEGWIEYHRRIASSIAEVPVVLYLRDARIRGEHLARLADQAPNLAGVKYALPDPARFAAVIRDAGLERLTWIAGLAEPYAPSAFVSGATGFTSGLANVAPELSVHMLQALRAGDYQSAMTVWDRIRPFEDLRAENGSANNVAVVKEALSQLGLCRPDVRPPACRLDEEDRARVTRILGSWDLAATP